MNPLPPEKWLGAMLEKGLGREKAPGELWNRVASGPSGRKPRPVRPPIWAISGIAAVVIAIGVFVSLEKPRSLEALAMMGLSRSPESLDFRSSRAPQIRQWVKTKTGLDVALTDTSAASIRLLGARVLKAEVPAAEIAFQIGDSRATLVVSKPENLVAQSMAHRQITAEPHEGAAVYSWTAHSQRYTLACASPREFQAACQLCHGGRDGVRSF